MWDKKDDKLALKANQIASPILYYLPSLSFFQRPCGLRIRTRKLDSPFTYKCTMERGGGLNKNIKLFIFISSPGNVHLPGDLDGPGP